MSSIEDALAAIEYLESGKDINYAQIAKLYSAERSTLSQRRRGQTSSRKACSQMQLSKKQSTVRM
jgi:hypothetical protein